MKRMPLRRGLANLPPKPDRVAIVSDRHWSLPGGCDPRHEDSLAIRRWLVYKLRELRPREAATDLEQGPEQWFAAACLIESVKYIAFPCFVYADQLSDKDRELLRGLVDSSARSKKRASGLPQDIDTGCVGWLSKRAKVPVLIAIWSGRRSGRTWAAIQHVIRIGGRVLRYNPRLGRESWIRSRDINAARKRKPKRNPRPKAKVKAKPKPKPKSRCKVEIEERPADDPSAVCLLPGESKLEHGIGRSSIGLSALPVTVTDQLVHEPSSEWHVIANGAQVYGEGASGDVLFGWISGLHDDRSDLESMGIQVGRYSFRRGRFEGCCVDSEALERLVAYGDHYGRGLR